MPSDDHDKFSKTLRLNLHRFVRSQFLACSMCSYRSCVTSDDFLFANLHIFRSDFSTGLNWLGGGYTFQPNSQHDWKCESQSEDDWEEEDSGCDKNHNNLPSWGESLDCDTNANKKCSFNSFCDRFSDQTSSGNQWHQHPSTSKCYCKSITKT